MGITGLLPFLEEATKRIHISEYRGCTVAIDTYCWLHKGAFGCVEKLVRGEDTNSYVLYCMKLISLLQFFDIRPILVFDGQYLPAKSSIEEKRREQREFARKRVAECLRADDIKMARTYMKQSLNITHKMALMLIKECRHIGVDCIVAPYEADAQLTYMNISGMADFVITEDSDLIVFGCSKVLFKLNIQGFGNMVEMDNLNVCLKLRPDSYSFDKFRTMCILSGCDYLKALPGIGLKKALKFVSVTENPSIYDVLPKLPSYLKMRHLVLTNQYREAYMVAEATFKHQIVFDPVKRVLKRLHDLDVYGTKLEYCEKAGEIFDNTIAFQLALGNIDPSTHEVVDNWSPDAAGAIRTNASIWSTAYKKPEIPVKKNAPFAAVDDKEVPVAVVGPTEEEKVAYDLKWLEELERYKVVEHPNKKLKVEEERAVSPVLFEKTPIPFKKLSKFQRTAVDPSTVVTSEFFSANKEKIDDVNATNSADTEAFIDFEDDEALEDEEEELSDEEIDDSEDVNFSSFMAGYCDPVIVICEPDILYYLLNVRYMANTNGPNIYKTTNKVVSAIQLENDMNKANNNVVGHIEQKEKSAAPKLHVKTTSGGRSGPTAVKKVTATKQLTLLEMFKKNK